MPQIHRPPIEGIPLSSIVLPPGCPKWISVERVRETLWVFQPYLDRPLTVGDAIESLTNAGEFMKLLLEWNCSGRFNRWRSKMAKSR